MTAGLPTSRTMHLFGTGVERLARCFCWTHAQALVLGFPQRGSPTEIIAFL